MTSWPARVSIVDARGLHGKGSDTVQGEGHSNLADAAVAAAMRYRVGGPLIDGLMADLGMTGGTLNGMLAGTGATPSRNEAAACSATANQA
ncbi:flotillin domain-containing protein [Novosphingobium sp. SG751A]|uniref:flotillin domain-containing protein n=1 Tax=Novosphingobium sp. SG751A TaxID=2587000 RepID=UPI0020A6BE96|nr:flotillin domain-containing protein [Novosphingobium sp. SG751A]